MNIKMFTSIVNEITRKTDRTESCNIRIIAFTAAFLGIPTENNSTYFNSCIFKITFLIIIRF